MALYDLLNPYGSSTGVSSTSGSGGWTNITTSSGGVGGVSSNITWDPGVSRKEFDELKREIQTLSDSLCDKLDALLERIEMVEDEIG